MLDNGRAGSIWDQGVSAFDENIGYGVCSKDGGQGCPSLNWAVVNDTGRGEVLEVTYAEVGVGMAAIFIGNSTGVDMRDYASGSLKFDIKVTNAGENTTGWIIKADCTYPCTSGDQAIGTAGLEGWESVSVPVSLLTAGGLDLANVSMGIVIWPDHAENDGFRYRLDNVCWSVG